MTAHKVLYQAMQEVRNVTVVTCSKKNSNRFFLFSGRPITRLRASHHSQGRQELSRIDQGETMPVLMVALLALAVFGGIGALLAAAVVLESRQKNKPSG